MKEKLQSWFDLVLGLGFHALGYPFCKGQSHSPILYFFFFLLFLFIPFPFYALLFLLQELHQDE